MISFDILYSLPSLFFVISASIDYLYKTLMLDPKSKVNENRDAIVTTVKHSEKKKKLLLKFFGILSKNIMLAELATVVPLDEDVPNVTTRLFFSVLSGNKSQKKEKILDEAMCHFCDNHRMKSPYKKNKSTVSSEYDFDYQPGSFATDLKTLFGLFKANGITYGLHDFECEKNCRISFGFRCLADAGYLRY